MGNHIVLYTRVSTREQNTASQSAALQDWLAQLPHTTTETITDNCSGTIPWRKRNLKNIFTTPPRPATLICTELSRLGRNTFDVLDFVREARSNQITIRAQKGNLTVDDSLTSKVLTTILALAAELERDFHSARVLEGLANASAHGRKGGRRPGPAKTHQLDKHQDEFTRLREARVSISAIARLFKVSKNTVYRYRTRNKRQLDILSTPTKSENAQ